MAILILPGPAALTPARLARTLAAARRANPGLISLAAAAVYLIDLERPLDPSERERLDQLLETSAADPDALAPMASGQRRWVVPRPGTVSPWSSKATDIAHVCGLSAVRRIERAVGWRVTGELRDPRALDALLHDRMTQSVLDRIEDADALFAHPSPGPLGRIALGDDARASLVRANATMGLALSDDEIDDLAASFTSLGRDPTDAELMMFAQVNSEHCRHKIFNARFTIDGEPQPLSLFAMIRRSTEASPGGVLSAYRDNAAVMSGRDAARLVPDPRDQVYRLRHVPTGVLMKVETHNHPTAIAPFAGAATGAGGEIRDEGATGRGARPKAGLVGLAVSDLRLPELPRPWEVDHGHPARLASPVDIMLDGPLGSAAFNNEFGRPVLTGYFRTFELAVDDGAGNLEVRGYHKPILLAGGLGTIAPAHVAKGTIAPGSPLVVLGGPALRIGLGGGAASSVTSGASDAELDLASVQRDNAEMQRRCQEVIDRCWALDETNPIVSIHDVGAGGLSNALPELVHDSDRGAHLELRSIPSDEPGMSPLEIWSNEAQERYVLALSPASLVDFEAICRRERAPFAVVGHATDDGWLRLDDRLLGEPTVDLPLAVMLGKRPPMQRTAQRREPTRRPLDLHGSSIRSALDRVLRLPTVADKSFLVTIGDRSVTGLVARDPMVGAAQVPVADAAVTLAGHEGFAGEAMAIGERPPVALLDAAASARMALAEAITNLLSAGVTSLGDIKLSANWMAAAGHPGEDARLFDAVRAVGVELAPALGIAIPVGKDSLSMRTVWTDRPGGERRSVTSPLSLVVTAFAPVDDVRTALTPEIRLDCGPTRLVLVDLGRGQHRLGGSCLAQVHGQLGDTPPDLDDPALLRALFAAINELRDRGLLLAYHDRSDGGLAVTLLEMAFAAGVGLSLDITSLTQASPPTPLHVRGEGSATSAPSPGGAPSSPSPLPLSTTVERGPGGEALAPLFAEELGAVVQVRAGDLDTVREVLARHGLDGCSHDLGLPLAGSSIRIESGGQLVLAADRSELHAIWSETTHAMARRRDDPGCADEEHAARGTTPGALAAAHATFSLGDDVAAPFVARGTRPRVAIVREQGVNGQVEMAAAFTRAGFEAVDVTMTDLQAGRHDLAGFRGLAACGGFSFGDVLGAGAGWARSILLHDGVREQFARFFDRPDTFALGVCNGCQMLTRLRELIPGAARWPSLGRNRSEQFEARLGLVEVLPTDSIFLAGMAGSRLPVAVAHGEGRALVSDDEATALLADGLVAARYVDERGRPTSRYPLNPSGSPGGITAFTAASGRVLALMPHPERTTRRAQLSWCPPAWTGDDGPWMRLFRNARSWVG